MHFCEKQENVKGRGLVRISVVDFGKCVFFKGPKLFIQNLFAVSIDDCGSLLLTWLFQFMISILYMDALGTWLIALLYISKLVVLK